MMKKMMTVFFAALCAGTMLLGMTGCGGSSDGTQNSGVVNPFALAGVSDPTAQTTNSTPTPTPTPIPGDNSAVTGSWTMNIDYSGMDEETAAQYHASFDSISMTMAFNDGGVMTTHAVNTTTGQTNDTTGSWAFSDNILTLSMSDGTVSKFSYQNGVLRCTDAGSTMVYLTRGGSAPTPQTSVPTPTPTPTPEPDGSALVGVWHMSLDLSGFDEATAEQYRQLFGGTAMTITLNADGSYQMAATNASTGQSQNSSGTWSMAGNTVTMTDSNTGGSENFTYANGRLASLETPFMYFTK